MMLLFHFRAYSLEGWLFRSSQDISGLVRVGIMKFTIFLVQSGNEKGQSGENFALQDFNLKKLHDKGH